MNENSFNKLRRVTTSTDNHVTTPSAAPLRVLIGCDTFTPDVNGAARFAERLAAGLIERGSDVHVVAPAPAGVPPGLHEEVVEGVHMPVHRLTSVKLLGHPWLRIVMPWVARREARRVLDAINPDVVHIQSHILVGRGLAKEAKVRGIRLIATNHIMPENVLDPKTPAPIARLIERLAWRDEDRILSLAEHVTTPTERAAAFLESNTTRRNVLAVSCGIDATKYTPVFEPKAENRIVFVGRINLEKQIDVIIRALARLEPEFDAQLDIVGIGDQKDHLRELAVELGVAERVHWLGKLPDEELRSTLSRGTVFAIASIAELQSIATLEALASGLPVVAANAMALPHLVNHGVNGFLFEPGNAAELADRLRDVFTLNAQQYRAMQEASLDMVKPHNIVCTLETFEDLYRGER